MVSLDVCKTIRNRLFLFLSACLSGILFALVWRKYEDTVQFALLQHHYSASLRETNYDQWLLQQNLSRHLLSEENLRYNTSFIDYRTESQYLYDNVPILCIIFANSHQGVSAVKETWARHCNIPVYFGRFVDKDIPVIQIPPITSFQGFCFAFIHVLYKYSGQYKWVLIADDLTYVSIANLRYYVAPLNESLPYYLGHPVKGFSFLYNIGTAGIVLSHGSMSLIHSIYKNAKDCQEVPSQSWYFDQSIAKILQNSGVHAVDTRDAYLRGRFNPFSVETMLIPGSISVFSSYWRTSAYLVEEGMNCCSDRAITFHGLLPSKMYMMEYISHHLAVFRNSFNGLGNNPPQATQESSENSIRDKRIEKSVGEAFVELVDKDWSNKKSTNKKHNKAVMKNMWEDIFG